MAIGLLSFYQKIAENHHGQQKSQMFGTFLVICWPFLGAVFSSDQRFAGHK